MVIGRPGVIDIPRLAVEPVTIIKLWIRNDVVFREASDGAESAGCHDLTCRRPANGCPPGELVASIPEKTSADADTGRHLRQATTSRPVAIKHLSDGDVIARGEFVIHP